MNYLTELYPARCCLQTFGLNEECSMKSPCWTFYFLCGMNTNHSFCSCLSSMRNYGSAKGARSGAYHFREEVGGMFIEADDALPELMSPQAVGEGPQLPLHLWPWINSGKQLPEWQPVEQSDRMCCSRKEMSVIICLLTPHCLSLRFCWNVFLSFPPFSVYHQKSALCQQITLRSYDQDL